MSEEEIVDPPEYSSFAGRAMLLSRQTQLEDFKVSAPPFEMFPFNAWKRQLFKHLNKESQLCHPSDEALGVMALRASIGDYLSRFHGIDCDAEQIIIHSGGHPALEFISRLLINCDDRIAVEEPGNHGARRIFLAYGAQLEPIAVDSDGMSIEELAAIEPPPKLVYTSPSHHEPTGAVLSQSRRDLLLDWACRKNAMIIEDHYDSEYRYTSRPLPALFASNQRRVIYVSTFWKVLGPIVRIGFSVFPKHMLKEVTALRQVSDRDALSLLEQYALADLISSGDLERTIKRNKIIYSARRNKLVMELIGRLGRSVYFSKESAGLHQYVKLKVNKSDAQILKSAEQAGLPLVSINSNYLHAAKIEHEFVIPFVHLSEQQIAGVVEDFVRLLYS